MNHQKFFLAPLAVENSTSRTYERVCFGIGHAELKLGDFLLLSQGETAFGQGLGSISWERNFVLQRAPKPQYLVCDAIGQWRSTTDSNTETNACCSNCRPKRLFKWAEVDDNDVLHKGPQFKVHLEVMVRRLQGVAYTYIFDDRQHISRYPQRKKRKWGRFFSNGKRQRRGRSI